MQHNSSIPKGTIYNERKNPPRKFAKMNNKI